MNATNIKTIKNLIAEGKSFSAISTVMTTLGFVKDAAEAEAELNKLGLAKGKRKDIVTSMYEFLESGTKTQVQFYDWIKANGTENTWRWRKSHDKVRVLTNKLHVDLSGAKFTDELFVEPKKS